jgi:sigma-E factor negative regulatory protein RseC
MKNLEGQVVSVAVDALGSVATVEVTAAVACARCNAGKGCGGGLLIGQSRERQMSARVAADLSLQRGDRVNVLLESRHLLRAAVIVYGYPLLGGVLAAAVALLLGLSDATAAIAALTGLVAGIVVARIRVRESHCLRELTPVVTARLSSAID